MALIDGRIGAEHVGPRANATAKLDDHVRGDVVISGHWQQPEATADTIRDGWLRCDDVRSPTGASNRPSLCEAPVV